MEPTLNCALAILFSAHSMKLFCKQRAWFWIAVAVVSIALLALLIPHGQSTDAPAWMALLPAFFVGLLVQFRLLPLRPVLSLGHTPQVPSLAPSFQRPPPFPLA